MKAAGNAEILFRDIKAYAYARQRQREIRRIEHAGDFAQPAAKYGNVRARSEPLPGLQAGGVYDASALDRGRQPCSPGEEVSEVIAPAADTREELLLPVLPSENDVCPGNAEPVGPTILPLDASAAGDRLETYGQVRHRNTILVDDL